MSLAFRILYVKCNMLCDQGIWRIREFRIAKKRQEVKGTGETSEPKGRTGGLYRDIGRNAREGGGRG